MGCETRLYFSYSRFKEIMKNIQLLLLFNHFMTITLEICTGGGGGEHKDKLVNM